jgi:hypothetical protein
VHDDYKPVIFSKFENWGKVVSMYELYAEHAGFSTKLGQSKKNKKGVISHRYIKCDRAGKPRDKVIDTSVISPARLTASKRTDCPALLKARIVTGTSEFEIYKFVENHNHGLLSSDNLDFTSKRRQLNFSDQEYIARCRLAKIGPTKAHKLQVALKGGHHNVRGTITDYKNFSRDIKSFLNGKDAQLFVNTMRERSTNLENFTFSFLSHGKELRCLFWVDDVSKRNYNVFGDVLAFDATYDTNM